MSHEFLSPLGIQYEVCKYCVKRKSLVCVRCHYCYECHPISEEIEARPDKSYFALAKLMDIEMR